MSDQRSAKPICVRLLGPYQITAHGEEVTKGLRSAGQGALGLVFVAAGRRKPRRSRRCTLARHRNGFGYQAILACPRRPSDPPSSQRLVEKQELLIRSGNHYHPKSDEITCDLWDFEHYLAAAARAEDDKETRSALRSAIDVYQGDFVSDLDYLWAEPVREDLHRRALDAHIRLAELEEAHGHEVAASIFSCTP